jgi:hypothetical protein
MSKNSKDRSLEITKKVITEFGDKDIYTSSLVGSLPIYLFSKLIYELQKDAIEDALEERFKVRNPFGPGGE